MASLGVLCRSRGATEKVPLNLIETCVHAGLKVRKDFEVILAQGSSLTKPMRDMPGQPSSSPTCHR